MRNILPKVFFASIAIASAASTAMAQTKPAPTPPPTPAPAQTASAPESNALQIVFVPRNLYLETRASGKLKENVFYWSNPIDSPQDGPKPIEEAGKPLLRIVGKIDRNVKTDTEKKEAGAKSEIMVMRAFNVPEGKTSATITLLSKMTYDVWEDPIGGGKADAMCYITRNGKQIANGYPVPTVNTGITKTQANILVPGKSQQVVIEFKIISDCPLDVASLNVEWK